MGMPHQSDVIFQAAHGESGFIEVLGGFMEVRGGFVKVRGGFREALDGFIEVLGCFIEFLGGFTWSVVAPIKSLVTLSKLSALVVEPRAC